MTRQEPHKPIKSENEQILVDSSSLPPKKMHNEKSERFGIPSSNEREAEHYEMNWLKLPPNILLRYSVT